jgi:hypothetical protein
MRNRSALYIDVYYDYNGDGQVTAGERVAELGSEQGATINPASRYYYCTQP